jgi:hypothetical protein
MSKHEIPIIVDSDVANGAINKSADGSEFEIQLEDPIQIPGSATSANVSVQEASIWWVIPNIITGVNDAFSIDDGVTGPFNVVVDQGLYDLSALQQSTESAVIAAGGPSGMFTFIADNATQKVVIRVNLIGVSIDFTGLTTFRDILGFNSQVLGPTVVSTTDFQGDNIAAFNTIDFFLIHSDLVSRGIRVNNVYDQVIAQVLIDTAPGSQIISTPFNPPKSPAWELIGATRNRIRFWLTDQNGVAVNTNNENWSARIIIEYSHEVEPTRNGRF